MILLAGNITNRKTRAAGACFSLSNNLISQRLRSAFLLPRVKIKKRHDNYQENNLPEDEHGRLESAQFVMRVHVDDERAERNSGNQPNDLTLCIPHF
jgi:hypothetical protein